MAALRNIIALSVSLFGASHAFGQNLHQNSSLNNKLAESLQTDPNFLISNIPPRSQGLPSSVYNADRMRPVRLEDRSDKDLIDGNATGVDASDAFNISEGAKFNRLNWFGIAEKAGDIASASLVLPDAHAIEMLEGKIITKLQTSPEVKDACLRGDNLVVVTKSYEGTPNIVLSKKSQAAAEAFAKIKTQLAEASLAADLEQGSKISYRANAKIVFAFEFAKIECDTNALRSNKEGIRLSQITSRQFAELETPHGEALAMARSPSVGGAPMYASRPIAVNASHAKNLTTLVAAAKAAGLVEALDGPGPFTFFAPTNSAFAALPKGTVETLLKPENTDKLKSILLSHVVPGDLSPVDLDTQIKKGGGKALLKTMGGESLTVMKNGNGFSVIDSAGATAAVTISDVKQSNGVVYVIDKVLSAGG